MTRAMRSAGLLALAGAAAILLGGDAVLAGAGQPSPRQIGLQDPVTPVAREIRWLYDAVNYTIIAITGAVLALMIYVCVRFKESANPTPSRNSHNSALEIAWTVIPVLILVLIAIPSFKLLRMQYAFPKPDVTIKATGYQWYWTHAYVDKGNFQIESRMVYDSQLLQAKLGEAEFKKRYPGFSAPDNCDLACKKQMYVEAQPLWAERKQPRLLAVDNEIVVPAGKVVHMMVTAADVIHSWTIPSLGSKVDAVPGRITATWFRADVEGIFYGQCSELCGKDHGFMPLAVRVVKADVFDRWSALLAQARAESDRAKRRELERQARELIAKVAMEQSGQHSNLAAVAN